MSAGSTAILPATSLDEDAWEDLLSYIEERRVIPIVGPELLQVATEPGESIWEFLHHRDDVLHDDSGARLIPLLIVDQFEELFTLAQSDEFGRARAARFIEELPRDRSA